MKINPGTETMGGRQQGKSTEAERAMLDLVLIGQMVNKIDQSGNIERVSHYDFYLRPAFKITPVLATGWLPQDAPMYSHTVITPPENEAERTVYYFYFGQPIINNYRVPFFTFYSTIRYIRESMKADWERAMVKLIGLVTGKYTLQVRRTNL